MLSQVSIPEGQLDFICRKYNIVRVWLFGSILRDDFSDESDVDILVEFAEEVQPTIGLLLTVETEFKHLFQREIDLGEFEAVREDTNYIRRHQILNSAQVIYER